jgi:hypothetical protein
MHYGHNLVVADFEASGLISILPVAHSAPSMPASRSGEILREKVGKGRTMLDAVNAVTSFSVLFYALWA